MGGFFSLGLRGKLALAALVLLALPWVGWRYVQEMEGFLLEAQEQTLLGTARAVSTALHERPALMELRPLSPRAPSPRPVELGIDQLHWFPETASGVDSEPSPARRESAIAREGEIEAILKGIERSTARIWVVNREFRVIALAGNLKRAESTEVSGGWLADILRELSSRVLQKPTENFDAATPEDVLSSGREVLAALQGAPRTRVRQTPDGKAAIVSAAHPI